MSDNRPKDERFNPQCGQCDAVAVIGPAIRRMALIYSLPSPYRHHHVIQAMAQAGIPTPIGHGPDDEQGFMTIHGFMGRKETALLIGRSGLLCSEDLW